MSNLIKVAKFLIKILFFFSIVYKIECFSIIENSIYNSNHYAILSKYKNLQEPSVESSFLDHDSDFIVYELCDNMLAKNNFLLPNKNWLALKVFLTALVTISVGTNNLVLAVNKKITVPLILLTQFTVPLNVNNVINLVDILRLCYQQGIQNSIAKFNKDRAKSIFLIMIMGSSIYLGYLSSLIDNQTSGNAYSWIISHFSNSKIASNAAYEIGYLLKLFFSVALNSVFFFNFTYEIMHKIGIGDLFGFEPSIKQNTQEINYYKHIRNIKELYEFPELTNEEKENYFSDRKINTILDIAYLKYYSLIGRNGKKISNAIINVSKICFITAMATFCSEAFRQIFASKLLFKNYIEEFSNHTDNGNYSFILKNGDKFFCSSIDNCISTLNIDDLRITNNQIDYILAHNKTAIIANILKGIAISTNTASMLIAFCSFCYKFKKNEIFKETICDSFFQKKNIIHLFFASSLVVSGYFYIQNVYNVEPVAEKVNKLLSHSGQEPFIPARLATLIVIPVMGLTISKGSVFLVDLSRSLISIINRIYTRGR